MNKQLKVLAVGEFSQLATGYSTYYLELLSRLHASGKYEIAELACYTNQTDPRINAVPWKVFPNHPLMNNQREIEQFNSRRSNEFGEYTFDDVCLRFRPDIVIDIRDHWMCEFEERSPARPYYKWVIMPTVDATPQHEQWIATYMNADAVFTYSDWGTDVLRQEGGGLINTVGSAPPGADLKTFYPMDKKEIRSKMHFEGDEFIIGTVMRNQGRKCYPELVAAFAEFLKRAPTEIAKKSYLYLHTSYPDMGWDIPRLIKQNGVSHKTIVTYKCFTCNAVFPAYFMDAKGICQACGQPTAKMPNVQQGVDRATLAKIINLFDVYVQYANSEGFGMPMVEAASCGVPVFATDYSAMSDVVRKVHGYPIKVRSYRMDSEFGCYRAEPDNQDFVDKLIKFFSLSDGQRLEKNKKARQGVEDNYTWESTTKKWMNVFDQLTLEKYATGQTKSLIHQKFNSFSQVTQKSLWKENDGEVQKLSYSNIRKEFIKDWKEAPNLHQPLLNNIKQNSNEELVRWAILNVLGKPELVNSYLSLRLIRDLNWGLSMKSLAGGNYANEQSVLATRGNLKTFTADDMINELMIMRQQINEWELKRWEIMQDLTESEKI